MILRHFTINFNLSISKITYSLRIVLLLLYLLSLPNGSVISSKTDNPNVLEESKDSSSCELHGECSDNKDIGNDDSQHKYSKETNEGWIKLLNNIEYAESNYKSEDDKWNKLTKGDCSLYTELIDSDLSKFSNKGITRKMIDAGMKRGTLYQILNGNLYRDSSCKFPARCKGIEHFLLEIVKDLPDTEFIVNTSDWPQVSNHFPDPIPILSFSKTKDYADIIYPAWTFWEGGPASAVHPQGLGRWDLMRKTIISASKKYPWDKKESKAFFRGSRTSSERDALIYLARNRPELVDAQYTKNQAWKSDADTLNAPAAKEITLEEHCRFKYLFNYRGVAASFRFKHLFLCNSLVFHVGDEWIEFFYPNLTPWIHYIPVDNQAKENDLKSLLLFVQEYDDVGKRIADRGFKFIKKHLQMDHVNCYWRKLILKYSTLMKYNVKPRDNLILLS